MGNAGGDQREKRVLVGRALARLRDGAGMTQEELARSLGCDRWRIGRYERGKSAPDVVTLMELLKAIGRDLGSLQRELEAKKGSPRGIEVLVRELDDLGARRRRK
jgi:transcriptional regulator with XRE-family HTH domain